MSVVIPDPAVTDWVPMGFGLGGPIPTQPSVRVYNNAVQSVPNNTGYAVTFNAVRNDNGPSAHWSASNPTRLTCQVAGTYYIFGQIEWAAKATPNAQCAIRLNGGPSNMIAIGYFLDGTSDPRGMNVSCTYQLSVGDYVEIRAWQNTGAAINITGGSPYQCEFGMALLGGVPSPTNKRIPTPVVNGQWIKGSGGAAIWAPITQPDLPSNLRDQEPSITDANLATQTGWYVINSGASNSPDGSYYWHLFVQNAFGNQIVQTAHRIQSNDVRRRRFDTGAGVWTAWGIGAIHGEPGGWPGVGTARIQAFTYQIASQPAAGHGGSQVSIPLPVTWPSAHYCFFATCWPGSTWAGYSGIISSLPNGNSAGYVMFENTSSANQMNLACLSIGS